MQLIVKHNLKWEAQKAIAPEMLESGPSGCRQSASFTGTHQGAAATALVRVDLMASDTSPSSTKESPKFSACKQTKDAIKLLMLLH